jgi:hypothetical protein
VVFFQVLEDLLLGLADALAYGRVEDLLLDRGVDR